MRLELEIEVDGDDFVLNAQCLCRRWRLKDVDRETLFRAWGEHCQERHRPRGWWGRRDDGDLIP